MLIRRLLILAVALVLVVGCVGPQLVPERNTASRLHKFHIVAMETPPLVIPGAPFSSISNGSSSVGSSVAFLPRYTIDMARAVGVLSTIAIFVELPVLSSAKVDAPLIIKPIETWEPSLALAQVLAEQIGLSGKQVDVSEKVEIISAIQDRGRTVLMENWMAPIRSWYNDNVPTTRYESLAQVGTDAIVEVGISNYEIFFGKLMLQVHVKLIDSTSGRLLGRARAHSLTSIAPIDQLFAENASAFKEAVLVSGKQLIISNLKELGLSPN